jgi:hypothetical protein
LGDEFFSAKRLVEQMIDENELLEDGDEEETETDPDKIREAYEEKHGRWRIPIAAGFNGYHFG